MVVAEGRAEQRGRRQRGRHPGHDLDVDVGRLVAGELEDDRRHRVDARIAGADHRHATTGRGFGEALLGAHDLVADG